MLLSTGCETCHKKAETVYIEKTAPYVYIPAFPMPASLTIEPYDYYKSPVPMDAGDDALVGYYLIPKWYMDILLDYGETVEEAAQILDVYYKTLEESVPP